MDLLQTLINEADFSHKDEIGHDPFRLREGHAKTKLSLEELFKQKDIAQVTPQSIPSSSIDETTGDYTLPKCVHFIWVGSALSSPLRQKLIAQWKEVNPDYEIILWTDQTDFTRPDNREMLEWCKQNRVHLINADDALGDNSYLWQAYRNEMLHANYGAASDILRLLILHYPGIYSDTDVACIKRLGDITSPHEILFNKASRSVTLAHPFSNTFRACNSGNYNTLNNDLLYVFDNGSVIKILMETMQKSYQMKTEAVLSTPVLFNYSAFTRGRCFYQDLYSIISWLDFKKQDTIYRTGPGYLHKMDSVQKPAIVLKDQYVFGNEGSWLINQKSDKTTVALVKQNVTVILDHLTRREPRILYLDALDCSNSEVLEATLRILQDYYPHCLQQVEQIKLGELDSPALRQFIANESLLPQLQNRSYLIRDCLLNGIGKFKDLVSAQELISLLSASGISRQDVVTSLQRVIIYQIENYKKYSSQYVTNPKFTQFLPILAYIYQQYPELANPALTQNNILSYLVSNISQTPFNEFIDDFKIFEVLSLSLDHAGDLSQAGTLLKQSIKNLSEIDLGKPDFQQHLQKVFLCLERLISQCEPEHLELLHELDLAKLMKEKNLKHFLTTAINLDCPKLLHFSFQNLIRNKAELNTGLEIFLVKRQDICIEQLFQNEAELNTVLESLLAKKQYDRVDQLLLAIDADKHDLRLSLMIVKAAKAIVENQPDAQANFYKICHALVPKIQSLNVLEDLRSFLYSPSFRAAFQHTHSFFKLVPGYLPDTQRIFEESYTRQKKALGDSDALHTGVSLGLGFGARF